MATKTFHPTSDIRVEHSLSAGSSAYSLLGSNDGDSTYIRGRINNGVTTVTTDSHFGFSGSFGTTVKINSIQVNAVARTLSGNSGDTTNLVTNLSINGDVSSDTTKALTSSYATYSTTYTASSKSSSTWQSAFGEIYTDISQLNLNVLVRNTGRQQSAKTDAFDNYTTELYLVVDYTEVSVVNCSAIAGANIASASVNKAVVVQGDSVTFTAVLNDHCTFDGWFTSASGGTPVSSNTTYTTTVNADTTLYARATVLPSYSCSAIAGDNVASATVSGSSIYAGESCTFTATLNPGNTFDGWYTAASGGDRVSTATSYTITINAPTTLYARATRDIYTVSVVASSNCSASVNRSTAQYGDSATFTATVDTGYDFVGWYTAASGGSQVSAATSYTTSITGNTTLYARATLHLSVISLDAGNTDTNHYGENQSSSTNLNSGAKTLANMTIYAVAVKWDLMSAADINNFNNGNFSAISSAARADYQTAAIKRQNILYSYWAPKLTINVPYGYTLGLYATSGNALQTSTSTIIYSEGVKYYWSTSNANNSVTGTGLTTNTWNAGFENYTTKSFMTTNDVGVVRIDNVTANGNYYYNSFAYHDNQLHATYGISSVSADTARNCTIDTIGIHATVQDSRFFFKEWHIGSENGTAVGENSADYIVPSNHHDYLTIGTSSPYTADMVMYAIADTNQQKWYPTAYGDAGVTTSVSQDWIVAGDNYAVTYSAEADEKLYVWKGWYRDAAGTDLVSTAWTVDYVPTAADQGVLYAKVEPRIYNITLAQSEGGTATATVTSGTYNTSTVLQWTADDNGWYTFDYWSSGDFDVDPADADYYSTQSISPGALVLFECPEPNKYILSNKTNITSYLFNVDHKYVVLWNDQLFINVPVHTCRYKRSYVGGSSLDYTLVLGGQDYGYPFGIYTVKNSSSTEPMLGWSGSDTAMFYVFDSTQHNFSILSSDNPYTHYITDNITISPVVVERPWHQCTVDIGLKWEIDSSYLSKVTISALSGHVVTGQSVTYQFVGSSRDIFQGWYSDQACDNLVSDEPTYTFTPEADTVLYLGVDPNGEAQAGVYAKVAGTYVPVYGVYIKQDGAYLPVYDITEVDMTKRYVTQILVDE